MTDIWYEARSFLTLSAEEKTRLGELTNSEPPSRFRQWLASPNPRTQFAVLAWQKRRIVGWAAADLGDGWNLGTIGAFVEPAFRGQGIARGALDVLLRSLHTVDECPEYLHYQQDCERLFRPLILARGFRDLFLSGEEYAAREALIRNPGGR